MRDNHDLITEKDGVILGISPDPVKKLAEWQEAEKFPFRLLSDEEKIVANLYGVWGEKKLYGNTYMGIVRSHFVVDAEGKFESVQYKISPKNSIKEAVKIFK